MRCFIALKGAKRPTLASGAGLSRVGSFFEKNPTEPRKATIFSTIEWRRQRVNLLYLPRVLWASIALRQPRIFAETKCPADCDLSWNSVQLTLNSPHRTFATSDVRFRTPAKPTTPSPSSLVSSLRALIRIYVRDPQQEVNQSANSFPQAPCLRTHAACAVRPGNGCYHLVRPGAFPLLPRFSTFLMLLRLLPLLPRFSLFLMLPRFPRRGLSGWPSPGVPGSTVGGRSGG